MCTKNEIKFIRALRQKKHRDAEQLFFAEGEKLVAHFVANQLDTLFLLTTDSQLANANYTLISTKVMQQISALKTPSKVFGVFKKPNINNAALHSNFVFVLDGVRDPGNMGTILRLCDWFGLPEIVCTPDCADIYQPKVVQASMGAVTAVKLVEIERDKAPEFLRKAGYKMVGTKMEARSVFATNFAPKTALVLGNEGRGISDELMAKISDFVAIPSASTAQAESLNVAVAASIFVSHYFSGH